MSALATAKVGGSRIAYDPNYRPRLWESVAAMQAFAPQIARLADILLPTFDDESAGFGDTSPVGTAARLGAWGCHEIVVKNGAAETLVVAGDATQLILPPQGLRPVDTSGAGDSFNGAYLAARLSGRDPGDAVSLAQKVAARVVMQRGALVPAKDLRAAAGLFG